MRGETGPEDDMMALDVDEAAGDADTALGEAAPAAEATSRMRGERHSYPERPLKSNIIEI